MNRTEELIQQTYHLTVFGMLPGDIREVLSIARRLHRIHERQCNGYAYGYDGSMRELGQRAERRDERAEERYKKRLGTLCGSHVTIQGDPRGAPLTFMEGQPGEFRVWG